MHRWLGYAFTATLLVSLAHPPFASEIDRHAVGVLGGDAAPPIQASAWLRGSPIVRYEPGRVYVVDLWATWCGPCLSSMPVLRRIQDRFPDRVTIIAMNVWEMTPDRVPGLVEARADSMPMWVALDSIPAEKEANEGLTAAAFVGVPDWITIPRTILIDGSGRVAWIGTPDGLEGPLEQVLAGTWDRDAWAVGYSQRMELEIRFQKAFAPIQAAAMSKRWSDAVAACEFALAADSTLRSRLANEGFAWVARLIVGQKEPTEADLLAARHALNRALELGAEPAWHVHVLAARVAKASGDARGAERELAEARRLVPVDARDEVPSSLEAL